MRSAFRHASTLMHDTIDSPPHPDEARGVIDPNQQSMLGDWEDTSRSPRRSSQMQQQGHSVTNSYPAGHHVDRQHTAGWEPVKAVAQERAEREQGLWAALSLGDNPPQQQQQETPTQYRAHSDEIELIQRSALRAELGSAEKGTRLLLQDGVAHRERGEDLTRLHSAPEHNDIAKGTAAHAMVRGPSEFDLAHGSQGGYIAEMGPDVPITLSHLFKRPLIRQWIHDGKIYRETSERIPSRFELFFDLVFVGVVHRLADGAAEAATGINVAKFVIVFYLAFSVWTDTRGYINQSGTDDVWQRLYILFIMILLAGFAANATAVNIVDLSGHTDVGGSAAALTDPPDGGSTGSAAATVSEHAARAVVLGAAWAIKRASEGGAEGEPEFAADMGARLFKSYYFAEGWHTAVFWAIAFFLIAKCARLLMLFIYGLLLPRFRKALWLQGLFLTLIASVFMPLMFTTNTAAVMILCVIGIVVDLNIKYCIAAANQWLHGRIKHRGHHTFFPAVSVEHLQERMVLFSILIIGESILNSTYTAHAGSYGFSPQFGRAALAIMIAFMLMWIYFDADGSRTFVHALRRHWWPSITFTNIHFPLCAALILMSSALAKLIALDDVQQGFRWFFSGSLALAMACIAFIALIHESLDLHGSAFASTRMRIGFRSLVAGGFALLPLKQDWSSLSFLGVHAAMLVVVVAFETLGKIGAIGRVFDGQKAEELARWREAYRAERMRHDAAATGNGSLDREEKELGGHGCSASHTMFISQSATGTGSLISGSEEFGHSRKASKAQIASDLVARGLIDSGQSMLNFGPSKYGKDWRCPQPTSKDTWHTYEDLSYNERGEEDVGNEGELGMVEAQSLVATRRWALASL